MKGDNSVAYWLIAFGLFLLNLSVFAPPFLIFVGQEDLAAALYNLHSYDHQWIYRSECVFNGSEGLYIADCIPHGEEANTEIYTLYTNDGDPRFNGVFEEYSQNQIGYNKAEKVVRNGEVGYKFANDTRDYAIYLPWLIVMLIYPRIPREKKIIPKDMSLLLLSLIPLAIDGTTQLLAGIFADPSYYWLNIFGLNESTNLIRWITGAIVGVVAGIYTASIIEK